MGSHPWRFFFACPIRGFTQRQIPRANGAAHATVHKEITMTIKIGDTLPEGTLSEFIEVETEAC